MSFANVIDPSLAQGGPSPFLSMHFNHWWSVICFCRCGYRFGSILDSARDCSKCGKIILKIESNKILIRNTMGQNRLCGLSLLAIEASRAKLMHTDLLINEFAEMKARRYDFRNY
jgi:hypothetical protein